MAGSVLSQLAFEQELEGLDVTHGHVDVLAPGVKAVPADQVADGVKTQIRLAKILKKKGVKLAFNPSSYLTERKHLIKDLLPLADVLVLNKEEAQMITKNKDLLLGLHQLTNGIVVITDKNKRIGCYDGKTKYYLKPNKIRVVERTGAGDAFASGFVAGLISNKNIAYCLRLGLRQSESVIRHFGAKNNLLRINLK